MPRTAPSFLSLPVSEQEESLRQRFIADIEKDYDKLSPSDKHLLELASWEYVKSYRMLGEELKPDGHIMTSQRHHPTLTMLRLLDAMAATGKERLSSKQTEDQDTRDLREALMSLGASITTRRFGGILKGNVFLEGY